MATIQEADKPSANQMHNTGHQRSIPKVTPEEKKTAFPKMAARLWHQIHFLVSWSDFRFPSYRSNTNSHNPLLHARHGGLGLTGTSRPIRTALVLQTVVSLLLLSLSPRILPSSVLPISPTYTSSVGYLSPSLPVMGLQEASCGYKLSSLQIYTQLHIIYTASIPTWQI